MLSSLPLSELLHSFYIYFNCVMYRSIYIYDNIVIIYFVPHEGIRSAQMTDSTKKVVYLYKESGITFVAVGRFERTPFTLASD